MLVRNVISILWSDFQFYRIKDYNKKNYFYRKFGQKGYSRILAKFHILKKDKKHKRIFWSEIFYNQQKSILKFKKFKKITFLRIMKERRDNISFW